MEKLKRIESKIKSGILALNVCPSILNSLFDSFKDLESVGKIERLKDEREWGVVAANSPHRGLQV